MKKSQKYSILLLLWLFLLSSVSFAFAATPGYVGIENNDVYTWNTTYDEGPLKDLIEDVGDEEDWSDSKIDAEKDELSMDEDLTGVKIVILDVDDEEKTPWDEDGVRIIYNFYTKEEGGDWDLEKEDETWAVWDYDKDFYDDGLGGYPLGLLFDWKFDQDEDTGEWEDYKYLEPNNPWFISTKTNWKEILDELDDLYRKDEDFDEVKIGIKEDTPGIQITLDEDEDDELEAYTWILEYDDNGVLMYYEWQYDGDPIVIVETQESQIRHFIDENILWIIIGAIGIVAVIVIVIVLIKRK